MPCLLALSDDVLLSLYDDWLWSSGWRLALVCRRCAHLWHPRRHVRGTRMTEDVVGPETQTLVWIRHGRNWDENLCHTLAMVQDRAPHLHVLELRFCSTPTDDPHPSALPLPRPTHQGKTSFAALRECRVYVESRYQPGGGGDDDDIEDLLGGWGWGGDQPPRIGRLLSILQHVTAKAPLEAVDVALTFPMMPFGNWAEHVLPRLASWIHTVAQTLHRLSLFLDTEEYPEDTASELAPLMAAIDAAGSGGTLEDLRLTLLFGQELDADYVLGDDDFVAIPRETGLWRHLLRTGTGWSRLHRLHLGASTTPSDADTEEIEAFRHRCGGVPRYHAAWNHE